MSEQVYRQATNKVAGLSDETAAYLRGSSDAAGGGWNWRWPRHLYAFALSASGVPVAR